MVEKFAYSVSVKVVAAQDGRVNTTDNINPYVINMDRKQTKPATSGQPALN